MLRVETCYAPEDSLYAAMDVPEQGFDHYPSLSSEHTAAHCGRGLVVSVSGTADAELDAGLHVDQSVGLMEGDTVRIDDAWGFHRSVVVEEDPDGMLHLATPDRPDHRVHRRAAKAQDCRYFAHVFSPVDGAELPPEMVPLARDVAPRQGHSAVGVGESTVLCFGGLNLARELRLVPVGDAEHEPQWFGFGPGEQLVEEEGHPLFGLFRGAEPWDEAGRVRWRVEPLGGLPGEPSPRHGHASVWVEALSAVLVVGGVGPRVTDCDVHALVVPPAARPDAGHSRFSVDVARQGALHWAAPFGATGAVPAARHGHRLLPVADAGTVLLVGGRCARTDALLPLELHVLDLAARRWSAPAALPGPPRAGSTLQLLLAEEDRVLLVMGGGPSPQPRWHDDKLVVMDLDVGVATAEGVVMTGRGFVRASPLAGVVAAIPTAGQTWRLLGALGSCELAVRHKTDLGPRFTAPVPPPSLAADFRAALPDVDHNTGESDFCVRTQAAHEIGARRGVLALRPAAGKLLALGPRAAERFDARVAEAVLAFLYCDEAFEWPLDLELVAAVRPAARALGVPALAAVCDRLLALGEHAMPVDAWAGGALRADLAAACPVLGVGVGVGGPGGADVALVAADGKALAVHRAVLAARSSIFGAMAHFSEGAAAQLSFPHGFEVLRAFVLFCYTDSVSVTPATAFELLAVAHEHALPRLFALCVRCIRQGLKPAVAAEMIAALDQVPDPALAAFQAELERYAAAHFRQLTRAAAFRAALSPQQRDRIRERAGVTPAKAKRMASRRRGPDPAAPRGPGADAVEPPELPVPVLSRQLSQEARELFAAAMEGSLPALGRRGAGTEGEGSESESESEEVEERNAFAGLADSGSESESGSDSD